jgi:putative peptidoglycan lipid II flippase
MSAFLLWASHGIDWLGLAALPRAGLLAASIAVAAGIYFGALLLSGLRPRALLQR